MKMRTLTTNQIILLNVAFVMLVVGLNSDIIVGYLIKMKNDKLYVNSATFATDMANEYLIPYENGDFIHFDKPLKKFIESFIKT